MSAPTQMPPQTPSHGPEGDPSMPNHPSVEATAATKNEELETADTIDTADPLAPIDSPDNAEEKHTPFSRRNILIGSGVVVAAAALGTTFFATRGQSKQPAAAPQSANIPSATPSVENTPSASPTPEVKIPKNALTFEAAMGQFDALTDGDIRTIIDSQDYTTAAQMMLALYINASQNQENFVDRSATAEIGDPVYEKNPAFRNMFGKDVTATELIAAASAGPQVLAAAQSTKGYSTEKGDPLDVNKAKKVINLAWGPSIHGSRLLSNEYDLVMQRLQSPSSNGTMTVRYVDFQDALTTAKFFEGGDKTTVINGKEYPLKYVQLHDNHLNSDVVFIIAGIPVEKSIYQIPAATQGDGYKQTALPTNADGQPIYEEDQTRVFIPTVIGKTFPGSVG